MPLIYLLPAIILIEGFASIAIEILTIRQLLPVAGGSVVVTSLIIGIFLLFLALGYEKGGRVKQDHYRILQQNFFLVALWSGVGMSYIFIRYFFDYVSVMTGSQVIYPLIIYLLLILAPMIYLLGQTLPITINMVKQDHHAGAIAGKALGLSTLGSFLGAVFTTLVLMHFFGVAWTVFIVFALLMFLSVILCKSRLDIYLSVLLTSSVGILVFILNVNTEMQLFSLTTNHANYQLLDANNSSMKAGQRMLLINDVRSSFVDNQNHAFPYIESMRKALFTDLKLKNANILVLGAGGFTLSLQDTGKNNFTYVDIDGRIKNVVEPRFINKIKDKLVINDARNFLNTSSQVYDAIITDVYSDYKAIPAHLLTYQFMQNIHEHLSPNGYALFNIIANPTFKDAYSKRIDNTIRSAFGSCIASPVAFQDRYTNIIYICSKQDKKDNIVYVDNLNNSTFDAFTSHMVKG